MSKNKGFIAEEKAKNYLITQGLKWIKSNFSCRMGEIDLIMEEENYLVFVEVRFRSSLKFGGAAESITPLKKKKLLKTALFYLMKHKKYHNFPARFDVVIFDGDPIQINWIKNAFQMH